jgi:methyltransferase family protein
VQVMNAEGMKSILCAGNGISQEPRALAQAGFQVVALDLSSQAVEIARGFEFTTEAFKFFCEPGMRQPGGQVEFVVGDILNPAVCPGPFDVIIERRTAQIFFDHDIGGVLRALVERLSQDGIFLSHCHDRAWRPPAEPRHFTKSWFQQNRWTMWNRSSDRKPPGRVAWFFTSTG